MGLFLWIQNTQPTIKFTVSLRLLSGKSNHSVPVALNKPDDLFLDFRVFFGILAIASIQMNPFGFSRSDFRLKVLIFFLFFRHNEMTIISILVLSSEM